MVIFVTMNVTDCRDRLVSFIECLPKTRIHFLYFRGTDVLVPKITNTLSEWLVHNTTWKVYRFYMMSLLNLARTNI